MTIECAVCGHKGAIIHFRKPAEMPPHVHILRLLLLVSALISIYDVWNLLRHLRPVQDAVENVKDFVGSDPAFKAAVENEPLVRDSIQLFSNATYYLMVVFILFVVFIPMRYMWLLFRAPYGHPRTLRSIRVISFLHVIVEAWSLTTILIVFANMEEISIPIRFRLNLIISPVIFGFTYLPSIREFFSDHTFRPLPDRPEPVAPPPPAVPSFVGQPEPAPEQWPQQQQTWNP